MIVQPRNQCFEELKSCMLDDFRMRLATRNGYIPTQQSCLLVRRSTSYSMQVRNSLRMEWSKWEYERAMRRGAVWILRSCSPQSTATQGHFLNRVGIYEERTNRNMSEQ